MVRWIQRTPKNSYDEDDLLIEKLAKIRGIWNIDDFLNPPKKYVHSPYDLDNIDEAVQRMIKAIHKDEKIQIFADIDADGVMSTGIMYNSLKRMTDNISYFHAQRSDGHGIEKGMDLIDEDTDLLIIVDSSSNSTEACKKISEEMNIDIIIIDHHIMDVENPYAIIVNCQQGEYKNKHLSGSAMCYKVLQVLDEYLNIDISDDYLDLCAIGLVGDVMNIWNMENRYLIYNGINKIENIGIQEILRQSKIDFNDGITTTNISFKISPIISACSRFDKIELALELITTDDYDKIKELAKELIELNERRKAEQKEIVEKVLNKVDDTHNLIIIVDDEIESGFRGLIASEIVEKFSKPVFVVKPFKDGDGNVVKYSGSARSIGQLPLKSLCEDSDLFIFSIGHEEAFGVEFKAENIDLIIKHFDDTLNADDLEKVFYYDLEVNVEDIDEADIKDVEKFSKMVGQGFPEPKFKINGIIVEEKETKKLGSHVRAVMGSNNDTIKINCEDNFALMRFRSNDQYAKDIEEHFYGNFVTELSVIGSLNLNVFYNWGKRANEITKQVFIEDYVILD